MKLFLLFVFTCAVSFQLWAQHTEKLIGVRLGPTPEVFFEKQNFDDLSSLRLMGGWRQNGRQFTIMKIYHNYGLNELPQNISFYYGYGAHTGTIKWNLKVNDEKGYYWKQKHAPVIGLTAIAGLKYNLTQHPLSVTIDTKPYFDFWGASFFKSQPINISLGATYQF